MNNNINSEFKNIVYDLNGIIDKKDVDIVKIIPDGNCLYRSISYFLFNNQEYYMNIKLLVIEWIENNYNIFKEFFWGDDMKGIKRTNG